MGLKLTISYDNGSFDKSYHLSRIPLWHSSVSVDHIALRRKTVYVTSSESSNIKTENVLLGCRGNLEVRLLSSMEMWLFGIETNPFCKYTKTEDSRE